MLMCNVSYRFFFCPMFQKAVIFNFWHGQFWQKGAAQATMLRSLSVVIVRSLSFANHSEHAKTDSNDGK